MPHFVKIALPISWTAALLGGGQPVAAAMPAPDANVSLQLRLEVPANADLSEQTLMVKAEGQGCLLYTSDAADE